MVKLIGVFQKFVKTKQNEVKLFKILQDRSKTNVFFSNCVEEKKRKNEASFFSGKKRSKTNIIVPQLSKICHCDGAPQVRRFRLFIFRFKAKKNPLFFAQFHFKRIGAAHPTFEAGPFVPGPFEVGPFEAGRFVGVPYKPFFAGIILLLI